MLIYREVERTGDPRHRLRALRARLARALTHEGARTLLIELGTLEAAIADARMPLVDDCDEIERAWRAAVEEAAALLCAHLRAPSVTRLAAHVEALEAALARVAELPLPSAVRLRVPEGFTQYGLYPEAYVDAALQLATASVPARVVCLGLRTVGAALSAVCAAALRAHGVEALTFTVRPRGHASDRHCALGLKLQAILRAEADKGARFAVVDEGPGLSGSSLSSAAAALEELGIDEPRIALLPRWVPDAEALASPDARARWPRLRKLAGWYEPAWLRELKRRGPGVVTALDEAEPPAGRPQHERVKYLVRAADGLRLYRFVGLTEEAAGTRARAERLHEAGFGPPVLGLRDGFLCLRWLDGEPLTLADVDDEVIDRVAEYVAWRSASERTGATFDPAPLAKLLEVNVREGLGERWVAAARLLAEPAFDRTVPSVIADARMLPHEWLRAGGELIKTDALDHGDDHFFPGPVDPAWDLAAATVELVLDGRQAVRLLAGYIARTADRGAVERLPFLRAAYLAFRLGYAALARQAIAGTDDAVRFAVEQARYERLLRGQLAACTSEERITV